MGDDKTETVQPPEEITKPNKLMEFYHQFRESEAVQNEIGQRIQRAHIIDSTVTETEVVEAFLNTEKAKSSLWDFYHAHPFVFNPHEVSTDFNSQLQAYYRQLRRMKDPINQIRSLGDRDQIINEDRRRSSLHTQAAEQLVKDGVAPNLTIARVLVHFIAIADGMDTPNPDREEKRRRALSSV